MDNSSINDLLLAASNAIYNRQIDTAVRFIVAASTNLPVEKENKENKYLHTYDRFIDRHNSDSHNTHNEFDHLPNHDLTEDHSDCYKPYYAKRSNDSDQKIQYSGYWVDDGFDQSLPATDESNDIIFQYSLLDNLNKP